MKTELDGLKNHFVMTLQNAIARLGPMPDSYGDLVKRTLDKGSAVDIIMLGMGIEEAMREGKWPKDLNEAGMNAGGDL